MEPGLKTDTVRLYPAFRTGFTAWLNAVAKKFPQYIIRPTETWRSIARQKHLYAQNKPGHWVTNMDGVAHPSLHQFGLAVDIVIIDRATGKAIWDTSVYMRIYNAVRPADYNMETLIPSEYGHLQIKGGYIFQKVHAVPIIQVS